MIRVVIRLLTLWLAAAAALSAQSAAPKPLLLWKAVSGKSTAYLFGSIHFGTKAMYPLPRPVEEAFASSTTLVLEIDLSKLDMQKTAASVMARGMYPPDDSLWKHVSADTRKAVEAFCETNGFPAEFAARMKPWVLALTLSTLPYAKLGMDPKLGLDMHFADQAKDGKRIEALETAEWQMELFSSLSPEVQEKLLATSVEQASDTKAYAEELVAVWSSGDAERVDALLRKHMTGPPEVTRKLLGDRNPRMADAIGKCLERGDRCFMVVGAGHLVGKDGVVSLLEKRGVKVEQVSAGR